MSEIELEAQLRAQRLREICEANQEAIAAREQRMREQEYLQAMGNDELVAEALSRPLESRNDKDRREISEQEQRFERERRAEQRRRERERTAAEPEPVNMDLVVATVVADERAFMTEVLGEVVAEIEARQRDTLDDVVRPLKAEISELRVLIADERVKLAEVRQQLAADHSGSKTILDLPALPSLRGRVN